MGPAPQQGDGHISWVQLASQAVSILECDFCAHHAHDGMPQPFWVGEAYQPGGDGSFLTTVEQLGEWLAEMAAAGEAVLVDGLATRVQRPRGWANQKVLYDPKRHTHTAQGLAISTIHGDLLWLDGGWPGCCHEQELVTLAGLDDALDRVEVASLLDRGFRGMAKPRQHWHAPVGDRRTKATLTPEQRAYNRLQAGLRALAEEQVIVSAR
jgi:hypothetical protein